MRIPLYLAALALLAPVPLAAQARYSLGIGVLGGTKLAEDRIFQDIRITQLPAPTLTLGASLPVSARERGGIEIALSNFKTRVKEVGFAENEGPGFRTLSLTGGVDGPMLGPLRYRVGAGVVKYFPDKEGIFRQGGPTLLLLTLGSDYHVFRRGPLGVVARVRYDYQRFNTDAMQSAGFTRTQDVHRLGVGLGIEYSR